MTAPEKIIWKDGDYGGSDVPRGEPWAGLVQAYEDFFGHKPDTSEDFFLEELELPFACKLQRILGITERWIDEFGEPYTLQGLETLGDGNVVFTVTGRVSPAIGKEYNNSSYTFVSPEQARQIAAVIIDHVNEVVAVRRAVEEETRINREKADNAARNFWKDFQGKTWEEIPESVRCAIIEAFL
jgi:hypothetical protein